MPIMNCPNCGRIFEDMEFNEVCPRCFEENENEIRRVKDYLYEHPNMSIIEVSNATGISIKKLKRFLSNERLVAVEKELL